MTDSEYEAQKARIQALIERWVKPLGLAWWKLNFEWERDRCKDDVTLGDGYSTHVAMRCYADWRYMEATIIVFLPSVAERRDDELEPLFVHELMHVFLREMREKGLDHEERVATTLAKAFVWVRGWDASDSETELQVTDRD